MDQVGQVIQLGRTHLKVASPNLVSPTQILPNPIPGVTKIGKVRIKTDPKLFVTGAINQATSRLNVRTEFKNYKRVILPKVTITMLPYFFTRPFF